MSDELSKQPPAPPRQSLIDPPSYPPPSQQHYAPPPQHHIPTPVFIQTAAPQQPRLEAGGWFARAFASTTGIILAVFFFLVVVPGAAMMLACGGCAFLVGTAADQAAKDLEREERQRAFQAKQQADAAPTLNLDEEYSDSTAFPITEPAEPFDPVGESRKSREPVPEKTVLSKDEADALAAEATRQRLAEQAEESRKAAERAAEIERQEKLARTRIWQSPSGAFKLEAEFVRYSNGKVTLRKADESEIQVDVEKLCAADKTWIESRRPNVKPSEVSRGK